MKKQMIRFAVVALSQLICVAAFCASPEGKAQTLEADSERSTLASGKKILRVGPTLTPPIIDGDLKDGCWRNATMASGFVTLRGEWPREQSTAYVTYDDTSVYIAFRCNEPAPEKIRTAKRPNDNVMMFGRDDTVEVFLDINHDGITYYHFGTNPSGTRYDARGHQADWSPDWELKTAIGDTYWTVEMRIPFASLGTSCPQPSTVFGINLCRTLPAGNRQQHSNWAMLKSLKDGFHRPGKFGELVFGDYPDVCYSVISMEDWPSSSELKMLLRNRRESPLAVKTQWSVGAWAQIVTTSLEPREEREICVRSSDLPFNAANTPRQYASAFAVSNAVTGEIYDFREALKELPPPMQMSLDLYYYSPDVEQMVVNVTWNTEETEEREFLDVEVAKESSGEPVASRRISRGPGKVEYDVSFDIRDWDIGRYVVSVHGLPEGGKRLPSVHRVLFKRTSTPAKLPPAAPKVSIRSDGIILLDEEPFCAFFASPDHGSPFATDCFNVRYGGIGEMPGALGRPRLPLSTIREQGRFVGWLLPEHDEILETIRDLAVQEASPLLYWSIAYEAQYAMYRGTQKRVRLNNVEELTTISRLVKSVDPKHLTSLQIDNHGDCAEYKDCADIIEVWCSSSSDGRHFPNLVRDLDNVRKGLGPGKPFVLWIRSFIQRADPAEEVRCASYLALMHGAAGIVLHMGHGGIDPSSTRHWSLYTGLSREIEKLFPILTSPQAASSPKITVQPAGVIDFCVREYKDRTYLIAVNTSGGLVNARVSVADDSAIAKRIDLLFESRKIMHTGNTFTDVFTAYEPHVYEFLPAKGEKAN